MSENNSAATCGSRAGYERHRRAKEDACRACRDAYAAWYREYRADNPDQRERELMRNAARGRAVWRLAAEYPERFRQLANEELRRDVRS